MKEVYTTRLDYEIDPAGHKQFHYFGQSLI